MTYSHPPWTVDDLGPASVHFYRLPAGAEGIVVLDNLALGPAIGGVRLTPTVTVTEVARLARAMTATELREACCRHGDNQWSCDVATLLGTNQT